MREVFRNIFYMARRFKLASALNLIGLVVSFAAFYLLMTQIIYQTTYNHGIKDYDRLYRLESDFVYNESEYSDIVCRPFADALLRFPDVVESYSLTHGGSSNESSYTSHFKKEGDTKDYAFPVTPGNNTALSTFSPKVLDGEIEWSNKNRDGFIIPARIAIDFFGTVKAAGKEMTLVDNDYVNTFKIVGVFEDFPDNSELYNRIYYSNYDYDTLDLGASYRCIVKFKSVPKDIKAFAEAYKDTVIAHLSQGLKEKGLEDKIETTVQEINQTKFKFVPLKDSYFESTSFTSSGRKGFRSLKDIMILACLLVILIAAINFLNFTLAESPIRVRSLNTRLVLGASRRSLRRIMVVEGVVISLLACLVAILLCGVLQMLPVSQKLADGGLSLLGHWPLLVLMLVIATIIGIVACYYPSVHATSFPIAMVLKSSFGLTPRGQKLRRLLTCFQLFISMLMFIYVGILFMQSRYIINSEYGYDKDKVLATELPPVDYSYSDNDTLYHLLKQQVPGVADVAFSDNLMGKTDGHGTVWTRSEADSSVFKYTLIHCSHNMPTAMGIRIVEGRNFTAEDTAAIIINEATQKRFGWIKLGSVISTGYSDEEPDSAVVVGICNDIRYGTTRIDRHQPFFLVYKEGYPYNGNMIVRLQDDANRDSVKAHIDNLLKARYGNKIKPSKFFNQVLTETYSSEFRYMNLMVMICIICLIITLIGIFCLTMFETEYRRKELGIRKAMGATTREIVDMLCRRYALYILISFAIAAPVAWLLGELTLRHFPQHTTNFWWLFPLALVLVGGLMLGTMLIKSWRSARENPSNSIRSE